MNEELFDKIIPNFIGFNKNIYKQKLHDITNDLTSGIIPCHNGGMLLNYHSNQTTSGKETRVFVYDNSIKKVAEFTIDNFGKIFWSVDGFIGLIDYNGKISFLNGSGVVMGSYCIFNNDVSYINNIVISNNCIKYEDSKKVIYIMSIYNFKPKSFDQIKNLTSSHFISFDFAYNSNTIVLFVLTDKAVFMYTGDSENSKKKFLLNIVNPVSVKVGINGNYFVVYSEEKMEFYSVESSSSFVLNLQTYPFTFCILNNYLFLGFRKTLLIYDFNYKNTIMYKEDFEENILLLFADSNSVRLYSDSSYLFEIIPENVSNIIIKNEKDIQKLVDSYDLYRNKSCRCAEIFVERNFITRTINDIVQIAPVLVNNRRVFELLMNTVVFVAPQVYNFNYDSFGLMLKKLNIIYTMNRTADPYFENGFSFMITFDQFTKKNARMLANLCSSLLFLDIADKICQFFPISDDVVALHFGFKALQIPYTLADRENVITDMLGRLKSYNIDYVKLLMFAKRNAYNVRMMLDLIIKSQEYLDIINFLIKERCFDLISDFISLTKNGSLIIQLDYILHCRNMEVYRRRLPSDKIKPLKFFYAKHFMGNFDIEFPTEAHKLEIFSGYYDMCRDMQDMTLNLPEYAVILNKQKKLKEIINKYQSKYPEYNLRSLYNELISPMRVIAFGYMKHVDGLINDTRKEFGLSNVQCVRAIIDALRLRNHDDDHCAYLKSKMNEHLKKISIRTKEDDVNALIAYAEKRANLAVGFIKEFYESKKKR